MGMRVINMKKLFLIVLLVLGLTSPVWSVNRITSWPCATDLTDEESVVDGAFKRESGATRIHSGILETMDGDDTPISNASLDNEAGATNVRVSVPDGQAWVHDTGGIIAAFADSGNLVIMYDGAGVGYMYGYLGEIGAGLTTVALANNVTAITLANPGVVSSIAHGLVVGDLVFFNGLSEMVELNGTYKTVTAIGSADLFSINDTSGYGFAEATGGACAWEVTEPGNTGVHVYKEQGLLNEGWLAYDTSTDFNAGPLWEFDIHDNRLTATGTGAEAIFEDGWGRFNPEGTNMILWSEDFSQWSASRCGLDTGEDDPRGGADATGLVGTAVEDTHGIFTYPILADNVDVTFSIFVKAGEQDWIQVEFYIKSVESKKCYFQLTGAGAIGNNNTTKESIIRLGITDWYWIRVTHNVGSGASRPFIRLYSAEANNDRDFTGDGSTIDTYVYGADAKQDLFLTSYVPTNGIPIVRTTEAGSAADNGISWTTPQVLKNILDDAQPGGSPTDSQGTLTFEIKWGCDESDIAGDNGLVSVVDSHASIAYFNATAVWCYDGASNSSYNHPAFSAGDILFYATRWGDVDGNANDMSAGLRDDEGTWSFDGTPANYAGSFQLGTDIRLGFGCLYPFHIRNIEFWDEPFEQAKVTITGDNATLSYVLIDTTDGGGLDGLKVSGATNVDENVTIYTPYGVALNADEDLAATNCLLDGYGKDVDVANTKTITSKNNCLEEHADATDNIGDGTFTDANSVYAQDPLFRNESGQDFNILGTSPCRNAGFDTGADTDLTGRVTPRATHDIGAYEFYGGHKGRRSLLLGVW